MQRYIDQLARYKLNHLHLHLTDDQGWRIAVDSWPNLATVGGSDRGRRRPRRVYTQADYRGSSPTRPPRYITVVPEIDMPGHTNAALAAYAAAELDEIAPPLYTGTEVGFSYVLRRPTSATYDFLADVLGEVAALTPGP